MIAKAGSCRVGAESEAHMVYRINYGNGQVGPTKSTYADAKRELISYRGMDNCLFFRIERYDGDGEWVSIGKAGRLKTEMREGV